MSLIMGYDMTLAPHCGAEGLVAHSTYKCIHSDMDFRVKNLHTLLEKMLRFISIFCVSIRTYVHHISYNYHFNVDNPPIQNNLQEKTKLFKYYIQKQL